MKPLIDFSKTIEKNKVVFKESFFEKTTKIILNIITTILLNLSGFALLYSRPIDIGISGKDLIYILIGIISMLIGTIVFINTIYNYQFKIVKGKNKELNKKAIIDLIENKYENQYNLTEDYIEITTASIINYRKKIIIIFKGNHILLKTIYYKNSPFHCCFDKRLSSKIRNRIINAL